MAWIIGVDEAGYGPNLGPLVMTSVACRVPEAAVEADLWRLLRGAVRRHKEADDGRLLIEDSKIVHSGTRGLQRLETGVLAVLPPEPAEDTPCLAHYLRRLAPTSVEELAAETWYTGRTPIPSAVEAAVWNARKERLQQACLESGLSWGLVRSVIVCPSRFNHLAQRWGSKGAVLSEGLIELIRANRAVLGREEGLFFVVDKHGGRNAYGPILQEAIDDGLVIARQEGLARSVYTVQGVPQVVSVTFQPRADAEHFCVALASMASKYVRELLMGEFNRFWQEQVPGLKATAGYPGDAGRFFEAILPALQRLGLPRTAVWREK